MWRRILRILGWPVQVHVDEVDVQVDVDEVDVDEVDVQVDVDEVDDRPAALAGVIAPVKAAPVIAASRPRRRVVVRPDDERATVVFVQLGELERENKAVREELERFEDRLARIVEERQEIRHARAPLGRPRREQDAPSAMRRSAR